MINIKDNYQVSLKHFWLVSEEFCSWRWKNEDFECHNMLTSGTADLIILDDVFGNKYAYQNRVHFAVSQTVCSARIGGD